MKSFLLIVAAFVAASVAESAVALTAATFDEAVKATEGGAPLLVEFFAPWCGHCKKLAPEYEKAAGKLEGTAKLATVDATVESDLASRYNVRGYPTLKFFRDGQASDYNGPRDADGIVAWVQKKSGPPSTELADAAAVKAFVEGGKRAVVATFKSRDSEAYKAYLKLAVDGDLDELVFGDRLGDADGSAVVYAAHLGDEPAKLSALTKEAILDQAYPLVDELPDAWARYQKKGFPLAILFLNKDSDNKAILAEATKAAEKVKGRFSISWADGVRFKSQIERMGGNTETLPSLAAMKLSGKANFPYDGELTGDAIAEWATKIVDGVLKAVLKSEEIPTEQGDVEVVVGKSFADYVAKDADVFLEVYAPWCGHCKSLAPTWEQLGKHYADNKKVIIAKVDGTANDLDESQGAPDVRGFPTIVFKKAGEKTFKSYDGGRDFDALKAYVEANAKYAAAGAGSEKSEL